LGAGRYFSLLCFSHTVKWRVSFSPGAVDTHSLWDGAVNPFPRTDHTPSFLFSSRKSAPASSSRRRALSQTFPPHAQVSSFTLTRSRMIKRPYGTLFSTRLLHFPICPLSSASLLLSSLLFLIPLWLLPPFFLFLLPPYALFRPSSPCSSSSPPSTPSFLFLPLLLLLPTSCLSSIYFFFFLPYLSPLPPPSTLIHSYSSILSLFAFHLLLLLLFTFPLLIPTPIYMRVTKGLVDEYSLSWPILVVILPFFLYFLMSSASIIRATKPLFLLFLGLPRCARALPFSQKENGFLL